MIDYIAFSQPLHNANHAALQHASDLPLTISHPAFVALFNIGAWRHTPLISLKQRNHFVNYDHHTIYFCQHFLKLLLLLHQVVEIVRCLWWNSEIVVVKFDQISQSESVFYVIWNTTSPRSSTFYSDKHVHADLNDRSSDRKGLASLLSKISEDTWFTNFNLLFFNFCHWQLRLFEAFVLGLWLGRNHLYWFVNDFSFTFQFSCLNRYCFLIYDFVLEKHFWRRNVCWFGVSFFITFGLTCFQCHERDFFQDEFRNVCATKCVWNKTNLVDFSRRCVNRFYQCT